MSIKEFNCKKCNKFYVSYKTLWEHNKKFHKNEPTATYQSNNQSDQSNNQSNQSDQANDKFYKCNFCNNIYKHAQSKFKHQQICKLKNNNSESEIIELKKENEEIKNSLKELKELIVKNSKIHPKKLQKINKDLMNSQNTILL